MLGMHMGCVPAPSLAEDAARKTNSRVTSDTEDWLQLINRASIVANIESGLLDRETGRKLANALNDMRRSSDLTGAKRSELYITFEPEMLKRAGTDASVIHIGRSSQDILATANAGLNLERLAKFIGAVTEVRTALLDLADREKDAVVPSYTNGVQAQPTLFAHYLLGHIAVFGRDSDRAFECIDRFDRCPMGSAVLNGTGWPLNVERMAELLGFAAPAANAFDAGQCSGNDLPLEISQIITSAMLHVNAFIADFMVQYAQPRPWIRIQDKNGVYHSSAMPQKRNPGLINDCRRDAGLVIGEAQSVMLRMQNLALGMADVRDVRVMQSLCDDACVTLRTFAGIVRSLAVDHDRALEELNSDWTCTQEIADRLVRLCGVDFRSGHGFASHLVSWAREKGVTPPKLSYQDASDVWAQFRTTSHRAALPERFPLSEKDLKGAISPIGILEARVTPGSANPHLIAQSIEGTRLSLTETTRKVEILLHKRAATAEKLDCELALLIERNS